LGSSKKGVKGIYIISVRDNAKDFDEDERESMSTAFTRNKPSEDVYESTYGLYGAAKMNRINDDLNINTLRIPLLNTVEKVKSGHPGLLLDGTALCHSRRNLS